MAATEITVSGSTQQFSSKVLLATAVVIVEDDEGSQFPVRALLDSGSEMFGWVVCGGLTNPSQGLSINCSTATTQGLEELVARFWASEEIGSSKVLSLEESKCEDIFRKSVRRESDGRYSVSLPKDEDAISRLGEARDIAFRRLQGTERRLARDVGLREQYHQFMEEYIRLGHMTKIEETADLEKRCYLPHHPVIKEASTTTKVRVVFDASCKTSSGVSLNDALLVGPIVQEDLRSIMLRSRVKIIMLVADVEKIFRQIFVLQVDRPLQCILWRFDPSEPVGVYKLNTVTYGTKPFLATRTLNQLAMDEEEQYPMAARATTEDTYMDDVITGADTVENARELCKQLNEMTCKGGFKLRKWASNHQAALESVSEDNLAIRVSEGINLDPDPVVKTLGLTWMPTSDQLKFQFTIPG
ncbi:uncharacterized protein LOC135709015 [Ochlerotatus camptorhynchus]|uniref:uncharacterized protein LOC135709015 n=1 Tax=Ochlerotatus camptorhynchus TaxID=644619 RepID=UPI0031D019B4